MRKTLALCCLLLALAAPLVWSSGCYGAEEATTSDAATVSDSAPASDGLITADGQGDGGPGDDSLADAPAADTSPAGPPFCEGRTRFLYAPFGLDEPGAFPDDALSVDDPDSPTGIRLALGDDHMPWLATADALVVSGYDGLPGLNGWGLTAALVFRFDGALTAPRSGGETGDGAGAIRLLELASGEAVPFEAMLVDDGAGLVVVPMRPLRPGARYALLMTTAQQTEEGGCVSPSPALRKLLLGTSEDPRLTRLHDAYRRALEATGLAAHEVSAATVFTAQVTAQLSVDVAADIRQRTFAWSGPGSCQDKGDHLRCERHYASWDYRVDGELTAASAVAPWELVVSIWLPKGGGAHPMLIGGHGINATRSIGDGISSRVTELGIGTITVDALMHGDHPSAAGLIGLQGTLAFLGVDIDNLRLEARELRDNFRQSTYDRLQLIELLHQDPDLDGDGKPDVDLARLGYFGVSLGGIMGSELLALDGRLRVGILQVAGARLTSMFSASPTLKLLVTAIEDLSGSEGGAWRVLSAVQTTAEPGDPTSYAGHILAGRFDDADPPHLLVTMAMGDDTVPNETTRMLARTLRIPVVPPASVAIDLVDVAPSAPASGNIGGTTAGLFQFDRVTEGGGQVVPADHDNVPFGKEATAQVRHFLSTWLSSDGPPEIIDPYATLAVPPLPAPDR